jgi:hypothetical protein
MKGLAAIYVIVVSSFLLSSCEFRCSVGEKKEPPAARDEKTGVRLSNEIALQPDGVKVDKAYLVFEDGSRVPDGNIVDFSKAVKLVLIIDKGWKETDGKVMLGASEKIEVESGEILLDEKDLFAAYTDGINATDAKTISLTARVTLTREIKPLTTFIVSFRVWDKNSNAFIQGQYKLYSK